MTSYSPTPSKDDVIHSSPLDSEKHLNHSEIASLAYERWQRRGGPDGSAEEDWLEAERDLESREVLA
ncbi:MAG TPA: DUF2934 domain-containing protein [Bryobacteraceae bacterium]|nr:DUF2934 domain-containing protein [Bryobacteraceae bacterium]